MTFRQAFFKYYDRAIGSGVCSFSQTGIKKDDFTRLCTDADFLPSMESLERAIEVMQLTTEEKSEILNLFEEASK